MFYFFDIMFSKFEQKSLSSSLKKNDDDDNDEMFLKTNDTHMFIIVIERFIMKYCKTILRIFIRVFDILMIDEFKSQIKLIFAKNYNISNVVYFGTNNFQ